jgi:hypothetical protein
VKELNNLLMPILNYGELLLTGLAQDDPLYADVQEISRTAHQLWTLAQELSSDQELAHLETQLDLLHETGYAVVEAAGLHGICGLLVLIEDYCEFLLDSPLVGGTLRADLEQMGQAVGRVSTFICDSRRHRTVLQEPSTVMLSGNRGAMPRYNLQESAI